MLKQVSRLHATSSQAEPCLEYLAYFAAKTIELVRAPDSYVYPAPMNVIETFLVAPLE
jgi:hypothetical protein